MVLDPLIAASHWLHMTQYMADPRGANWTGHPLDVYDYTLINHHLLLIMASPTCLALIQYYNNSVINSKYFKSITSVAS